MAKTTTYLVSALRSPIGKFLGGLSKLTAVQIGAQTARAVLERAQAEHDAVDDAIVGQVLQAGCGQNPARQVALGAGLPDAISACTVNKVCGSGLQSVIYADQVIRSGDADVILAGGIESMSQAPFLVRSLRGGAKFGHTELTDEMLYDGLTNVYDGRIMGDLAEYTAKKAGVTREQQDAWSLQSHQRAAQADSAGWFDDERIGIELPRGKGALTADETIRADATLEALSGLKPAFQADGVVTAGNASALSDGAAMTLLASEAGLQRCGAKPLARIVASTTAGGPPEDLFFAPIAAIRTVVERAGWTLDQVDAFDLNEAFAAQTVADVNALELDPAKVNMHGGAIALGHPIGASGARVLTTLTHILRRRKLRRGVAALCLGGGNAVAVAIESV